MSVSNKGEKTNVYNSSCWVVTPSGKNEVHLSSPLAVDLNLLFFSLKMHVVQNLNMKPFWL